MDNSGKLPVFVVGYGQYYPYYVGVKMFKIIVFKNIIDIEKELNNLAERWKRIDVQSMMYNERKEYIAIVKLEDTILPNTFYTPLFDIRDSQNKSERLKDDN